MNVVDARAPRGSAEAQRQLARLRRLALVMLRRLKLDHAELSLTLVGDRAIRGINKQWRGKDRATDVLSFPAGETLPGGTKLLGDVIISRATAKRAARRLGTTVNAELELYLAHGLLHLLGHDHHTPAEAKIMAKWERTLLGGRSMLTRADEA